MFVVFSLYVSLCSATVSCSVGEVFPRWDLNEMLDGVFRDSHCLLVPGTLPQTTAEGGPESTHGLLREVLSEACCCLLGLAIVLMPGTRATVSKQPSRYVLGFYSGFSSIS